MTHIMKINEFINESRQQADDRDKCYLKNPEVREEFMKFIQVAENDDWTISVTLYENKGDIDIDCQKYSPAGQDFSMCLQTKDNEDVVFSTLISDYIDNYDVEEEAEIWSEESGEYDDDDMPIRIGKNGAPQDWDDLVADMEACKSMMQDLVLLLAKERL